ncbi:hypothetical protein SG34_012335 [Thalassomonas viridans]|uniref:EF-hand domain-containing protein n=1 Tax=Thalassomonas viridans TaxID=137584 RepID=A0AAE9Z6H2_9GAMM|nr:hypothetical protein [Thalassomonas viridans]WDE07600.1 hypothetical protein SG34_012335 [Thalassomonas viridans]
MNQISLLKVSLAVIACALVSAIVHAGEDGEGKGVVSEPALAPKRLSSIITAFDTDKNGKLNESEILASRSKTLHKRLARIDLNQDQEISHEELMLYLENY